MGQVPLCETHFREHYSAAHGVERIRAEISQGSNQISTHPSSRCSNEKKKKIAIGVGTWNIHKLSKGGDPTETKEKLVVIDTLFQSNPWLDVIALQEVNSTGLGHLKGLGASKMISSGPLLEVEYEGVVRYAEYYPLLVSNSSPGITLQAIELYWGNGKVTSVPVGKPGTVTYKGEGAPDDIMNRPVVVYTVQKAGCDYPVKIGVVHTSPGYGSQFDRVAIFEDQVEKPLLTPKKEEFAVFVGDYYLPPEARVRKTSERVKDEKKLLAKQIDVREAQRTYKERYNEPLQSLKRKIDDIDKTISSRNETAIRSDPEADRIKDQIEEKTLKVFEEYYPEKWEHFCLTPEAPFKLPNTRKEKRDEEETALREEIKKLNGQLRRQMKKVREKATTKQESDDEDAGEQGPDVPQLRKQRQELVNERKELESLWPSAGINEVRNVANLTMQQNLPQWQTIVGSVSGTNIHGKDFELKKMRSADYCIASGPWTVKCGGMFKDLPLIEDTGKGGCLIFDEGGMAVQNWMKISDHAPAGGYFSNLENDPWANVVLCLDERALQDTSAALKKLREDEEEIRLQAAIYEHRMREKARKERIQQEEILLLQRQMGNRNRSLNSFCQYQMENSIKSRQWYEDEEESAHNFLQKPTPNFDFKPLDFEHQEQHRKRRKLELPEQEQKGEPDGEKEIEIVDDQDTQFGFHEIEILQDENMTFDGDPQSEEDGMRFDS